MALWRSTWPSTLSGLRLWQRLAIVLLPLLVLVTALELWMTRHDALEAANAAYDRSLVGALKAIDAGISTASGGLTAELPYSMLEFFELTASGPVYFRVASSDGLVELGNVDLPLPPGPLVPGVPRFYDAIYFGESVRLPAYRRALARAETASTALVHVAASPRPRQGCAGVRFRPGWSADSGRNRRASRRRRPASVGRDAPRWGGAGGRAGGRPARPAQRV
mgnify:CR=1 FL=1